MLFKCVLAYVVVFYSQIGTRIQPLESLRPELVLGSLILIAIGATWKQPAGTVARSIQLSGSIVFLFVAMALSIPGSYWITKSVDTMLGVFKMFSLYIMIMATIDTEAKLRQFMWVYVFMVTLIVGEPFIGVFTGSANWDDHRGYPKLMGTTGLWAHPNSLGGFAAANLAFLYYLFLAEQQKMKKYFLLGLGLMSLETIILTGSRTAYVGIIGIAFLIWLRSARKGLAIAMLIAGLVLTWIVAPQAYKDQFLTMASIGDVVQGEQTGDGSINERWEIVTDAVEIFLDHPIFGVGVDAFMTVRGERFNRWQDTHNLYLQILTNVGIVGLLAFVIMLYSIFQSLGKAKQVLHRTRSEHSLWLENLANAVAVFLSARLIVGMFGMDFYENYWWLAAGLAGVLFRLATEAESHSKAEPSVEPLDHSRTTRNPIVSFN